MGDSFEGRQQDVPLHPARALSSAEDLPPPEDIEERIAAVKEQISMLFRLNALCETNFDHLSTALHAARKRDLVDATEFAALVEINRKANEAKHSGLGVTCDSLRFPVSAAQTGEDASTLGNCIGELEQYYSRLLGRSLRKNEPRYRYGHRPCNMGLFVAAVCLDALPLGPAEFFGDAYALKQLAKHSAARQAVLHLMSVHNTLDRSSSSRGKSDTFDGQGEALPLSEAQNGTWHESRTEAMKPSTERTEPNEPQRGTATDVLAGDLEGVLLQLLTTTPTSRFYLQKKCGGTKTETNSALYNLQKRGLAHSHGSPPCWSV